MHRRDNVDARSKTARLGIPLPLNLKRQPGIVLGPLDPCDPCELAPGILPSFLPPRQRPSALNPVNPGLVMSSCSLYPCAHCYIKSHPPSLLHHIYILPRLASAATTPTKLLEDSLDTRIYEDGVRRSWRSTKDDRGAGGRVWQHSRCAHGSSGRASARVSFALYPFGR